MMQCYFDEKKETQFNEWKKSGYPNVRSKTYDFINNMVNQKKKHSMWEHQIEGMLRTIYAFEILKEKNLLLNIVTGGGKTAIIASIIFWLKSAHNINKFLILAPNTIVRSRLESDFKNGMVFEKFEFGTEQTKTQINELGLHVMKQGESPQGMIESGIILGNIQQLYSSKNQNRNLAYMIKFIGDMAVFNDEAHNTPAPEYTEILNVLSEKCKFRLDTTATPERADGREPDSNMIYHYDISSGLNDQIIKSIVVYQPEVKLLEMTYSNPKTGEKKDIVELDAEFKTAEKNLKPFQWILDPEPMKKQIAIALQRHEEQKERARDRYKPILFVVTMSIQEGQKVQETLENIFKIKTLLVTEESDEDDRNEALNLGSSDSKYDAVVSVLMLREGWDVPEVSTILLLRKFSSPVYGQQIIGRGLRKIIREGNNREILAVVDHPRLEHDWLWKIVAVSKIKQLVEEGQCFGDEDLPNLIKTQRLVRPEKIITIPSPIYKTPMIPSLKDMKDDDIEKEWCALLDKITYDKERLIIKRTSVKSVESKELGNKRLEVHEGIDEHDYRIAGEYRRDVLNEKFKNSVLKICAELVNEAGFKNTKRVVLYHKIFAHICDKIFSGKSLNDARRDDIEFAMYVMPEIKSNFTIPMVTAILEESND